MQSCFYYDIDKEEIKVIVNKPLNLRMGVRMMTNEQEDRIVETLVNFVERVSKGIATSETEIAVLPEVAKVLFSSNKLFTSTD